MRRICAVVAVAAATLSRPASAVKITELTIPTAGSHPFGIAVGPDGRVWFCESTADQIGAVTIAGVFSEYPTQVGSHPYFITTVPDRLLAFTSAANHLGFMSVAGYEVEVPGGTSPLGIVAGPDGRIWIAAYNDSELVARQWLSNSPATATFTPPTAQSAPWAVAVGPERWIWYTESNANRVGVCAPYNASLCSDYPIPTPGSDPRMITLGPDANLWFTEETGNKIGRVTSAGVITEFPLPTPFSQPFGIAAGPDGNLWFTEYGGNKIGRITPAGVITEYPVPTANSAPYVICMGPDGQLWFTEYNTSKIGRVAVFVPGDVDGAGGVAVNDVFYLINFLFAGGPAPK
jgi:streptogramin lyase